MRNRRALTRVLAAVGTMLVWLPILATGLTALGRPGAERMLHVDYLMPAELFPGRARRRRAAALGSMEGAGGATWQNRRATCSTSWRGIVLGDTATPAIARRFVAETV
jgi:hypothetical protein